jgi:hypothetical protein
VLGEIDVDQLGQCRRLDQTLLAPQLLEHPLERLGRRLLRLEPASLHALGTTPANPIPIRPLLSIPAPPCEPKHLPLLWDRHHLKPSASGSLP